MRIKPDGIDQLMQAIDDNLKFQHKVVTVRFIELSGKMARAVGEPIEPFADHQVPRLAV